MSLAKQCHQELASGQYAQDLHETRSRSPQADLLRFDHCIHVPPTQRSSPIIRYPSICLAAAATRALRNGRILAKVLLCIMIELFFALGATEVICLPSVLGVLRGRIRINVHTTNWILHNCCAAHMDLLGFLTSV
jgi:hypothetical protein